MLKVNVFLPEDTTELENKFADVLSDILIKKLSSREIDMLIEALETTDIPF